MVRVPVVRLRRRQVVLVLVVIVRVGLLAVHVRELLEPRAEAVQVVELLEREENSFFLNFFFTFIALKYNAK
jgi:hypothetical protein